MKPDELKTALEYRAAVRCRTAALRTEREPADIVEIKTRSVA